MNENEINNNIKIDLKKEIILSLFEVLFKEEAITNKEYKALIHELHRTISA